MGYKNLALSVANKAVPFCPGMSKRRPTYYQGRWLWPSTANWQSLYFRHEPNVGRAIQSNLSRGGVFYDIGASVGWFSLFAAGIVGPSGCVFAFEPAPAVYAQLSDNVSGMANIHTFQCGIGSADGDFEFAAQGTSSAASFVQAVTEINKDYLPGTPITKVKVNVRKIDTMLPQMQVPNLVKIDVEGFELNVLKGAERLLVLGPSLIAEIHPTQLKLSGGSDDAVFDLLKRSNYSWTVIDRNPNSLYTILAAPK